MTTSETSKRTSRSASGAARSAIGTCANYSTPSSTDRLTARLRQHLAEAAELGQIRDGADIDFVTHQLVVLIDGVSAERVLYQNRVPPKRQVDLLDALLNGLRL